MTTEQAIKLLHRLQDEQFDGIHGDERREALSMAVRALEPNLGNNGSICTKTGGNDEDRTTGDTIYRQAAIKAFDDAGFCTHGYIVDVLEGLPSSQPERKKGKWLVDEDGNMECPFCGNTCGFGNYCNECGADMRGEQDG